MNFLFSIFFSIGLALLEHVIPTILPMLFRIA